MRLLLLGAGYTARRLARSLPPSWRVEGTVRSAESAAALAREGIGPVPLDADGRVPDVAFAAATHILVSIPPDGDPALHGQLGPVPPALAWVGYLSATSVYGDRGGLSVDETTPPAPIGPRGEGRLAAETAWLGLLVRHRWPTHIFRLAGIYGPGRSAFDAVRAGTAQRVVKPGHTVNRVHVDDIVATLRQSMARPAPGEIYNVADDCPAASADVTAEACALLGVAPPPLVPFEAADLSPRARSFYDETKRVLNAKIKRDLGVTLQYPSYREGLRAILAEERNAASRGNPSP